MPKHEFTNYEKRNHIAYFTINWPERMNAMHPPATPIRMGR